jgi:hypothetical protein
MSDDFHFLIRSINHLRDGLDTEQRWDSGACRGTRYHSMRRLACRSDGAHNEEIPRELMKSLTQS